ncbi:hypothetical protein VTJ49DRAFT_5374 [Mycothermus thermophilus]|uniref:COP9 signalosome complex subunit 3 N-terminal helical repeats domain-containing protein n=1 Tax=Humicola insolens TaxID=85995 RepID=A0ABR3V3T6_HUMIN
MDQLATLLLGFPPASGFASFEDYHSQAKSHNQTLDKLAVTSNFRQSAAQLLKHVDPAVNSMSHLALLNTAINTGSAPLPDLLAKVSVFLCSFDPQQIRYSGKALSSLLEWALSGSSLPASVAVDVVTTALLRLDSTGSVLTSHHVALAKLALDTDNITPALPLLDKNIVSYPGIKSTQDSRPLCSPDLPPAAYMTIETGLTKSLTSTDVLQYDLIRGLCYIQLKDWGKALDALERVVTYPARDNHSCSKIMVEAHNKWLLVGLLRTGKTPELPPTTAPGAQKAFATLGKPYHALAKAFEDGSAATLRAEFETIGPSFFSEENNLSLVHLVLQHFQRWQILNLRHVYTAVSLEQIRQRTHSAITAAPLATEEEVEQLLRQMMEDGMLRGVVERPADRPAHLRFLDDDDASSTDGGGLSEAEFARRMQAAAERLRELAPLVRATSDRLGGSREYIKYLVEQQKRELDGRGRAGTMDDVTPFMSQIEDEDLMTGVVPGY